MDEYTYIKWGDNNHCFIIPRNYYGAYWEVEFRTFQDARDIQIESDPLALYSPVLRGPFYCARYRG